MIKPVAKGQNFAEDLRPEIYELLRYKDGITALPVGVHVQNHVVYNRTIFDNLNLALPLSWDEFIQAAEVIKAEGYIPLSISDQRWQLRFLFSSILAERLTAAEFSALIASSSHPKTFKSTLVDALKIVGRLRNYANTDSRNLHWAKAVKKIVDGQAAASFLGDFSSPFFAGDEGKKFVCGFPPGNTYLLWAFDVVALTSTMTGSRRRGQDAFIYVATSQEYLAEYLPRKGGVPPYKFIDPSLLNACSRQSLANWETIDTRIHLGPDTWNTTLNAMASVVQKHWRDPESSPEEKANDIISALISL